MKAYLLAIAVLATAVLPQPSDRAAAQAPSEATEMTRRLVPRYPSGRDCSPITSLFSSWDDVDGDKRDEPHTGIDAGRIGEAILAPAPGTVIAVWRADWGWGPEGALMMRHDKADLGLTEGPDIYYSEFDHLRYDEIAGIAVGRHIARGDVLAHVSKPGGDPKNLSEVHWEVWSIGDDRATVWDWNEQGARYWHNDTGHLLDPLYMMSLNGTIRADGSVPIQAFDPNRDYSGFRGFTYILRCPATAAGQ